MRAAIDERDRFRAVFEAHYPAILTYARRRIDPDIAPDVAAEVFATAWRRRTDLPHDPLPWLYGVARRVIANQRRGAQRALRLTERVAATMSSSATAPAPAVDPGETVPGAMSFAAAFDRLSDDDREVLRLLVWERLGGRGIAIVLECSVPAVTMRISRARRRLRAQLLAADEED